MIFYAYLGLMGAAILLSLFNVYKGDRRLLALASKYSAIVAGFHLVFMTWLHLGGKSEFVLLVAGAQALIAYESHKIGCRAAKIITPLAWIAVFLNCAIYTFDYPHVVYYYSMNLIQGSQIASLIFASSVWHGIATLTIRTWKATFTKGMHYERTG